MELTKEDLRLDKRCLLFSILLTILVITPYFWVRILGWSILFYLINRLPIIGVFLLSFFSFFFDDRLGTFQLFFTLKPFHIILIFLIINSLKDFKKNMVLLKKFFSRNDFFILLFLVAALLSGFYGDAKLKSTFFWFNLLLGLLGFVFIRRYALEKINFSLVVNFFILGGIAKTLYFVPYLLERNWSALFHLHAAVSSPLPFLFFLLLSKYYLEKNFLLKFLWLGLSGVSCVLIFSSGTRGFILGLFLSLVIFLATADFFLQRYKSIAVLVMILLSLFYVYNKNIFVRGNLNGIWINIKRDNFKKAISDFNQIPAPPIKQVAKENLLTDDSHPFKQFQKTAWTRNPILWTLSKERVESWSGALSTIKENPFFGRGLRDKKIGSHNLYLEIFAATGVFGFIGFFGFIGTILIKNILILIRNKEIFCIGFIAGIVTWLFSSLTSTYYVQHYIWVFLGMAGGLINFYYGRR